MTPRIIWIALLSAALAVACSAKNDKPAQDSPGTQSPASATVDEPGAQAGATTPAQPATPPRTELEVDPGNSTGKHLWSTRIGGVESDAVRDVAIDAQGNVALTGFFSSGADLGDGKPVDAQKTDVFVSKYDPAGKHLWTVHFGGKGEDVGNAVAFDPAGNVVVAGLFYDQMQVGAEMLVGMGSDDAFMAKFSPEGTPLWARKFGGADSDTAYDIAVTSSGNLLVTGSFKGTVTAADETFTSKGNEDIFLLMLNQEGDLVWSKQFGERYRDFGQRVAVDSRDQIVLLGTFSGQVGFGGQPLTSEGNQDLVVAKYDASGEHIWSRRFGSVFDELGLGLAVDPAGNIVITGSFDNEISFGGDKLKSQGESDIFVAKLSPQGEHMWSRRYGAARDDVGYGVGTDKYGNIVVGGWFWHTVDFGGGPLEADGQNKDAFLLKLSAKGEHLWSRRIGGRDHDQSRGVDMNEEGRSVVAGIFRFTVDLGGQPLEAARKPDDLAPPADVFLGVFER
jgi:hypothetical protein